MASHVVVVDASARRATVKTNTGTYLSDIRDEACKKLGVAPGQYTLKYNQKALDLSRTIRLSSLPQGARLDLVQYSRSPTVISVALQLPASENNARLTQKFSSHTSLWQILRIFESSQGAGANYNFTQRAAAAEITGSSGAGRLHYETPVLNLMGRERASFEELQQTLGQLGITGNVLIRLSFRNSGKPLEDAMAEISQYFKSDDGEEEIQEPGSTKELTNAGSKPQRNDAESSHLSSLPHIEDTTPMVRTSHLTESDRETPHPTETSGPGDRSIVVFSPPTSDVPQAASQPHNATEYDMSIDQARRYQQQLQDLTRNKRLPSDAEIAEKEKAKSERLAAIQEVRIRIRLPDQTQVEARFTKDDTAKDLFELVRNMLVHGEQPFWLRYSSAKGTLVALKEGPEKLVGGLGFQGRVLVTCTWNDSVPLDARKAPSLKEEWRAKAQTLNVDVQPPVTADAKQPEPRPIDKGKGRADPVDKESKLKAMLNKSLFKKR